MVPTGDVETKKIIKSIKQEYPKFYHFTLKQKLRQKISISKVEIKPAQINIPHHVSYIIYLHQQ